MPEKVLLHFLKKENPSLKVSKISAPQRLRERRDLEFIICR